MPQATPKMLTKQLRELEEDRGMVMLFEKLAHERYSVRSFQSKPVEKEKIQKIIAIANSAPTAEKVKKEQKIAQQKERFKKSNQGDSVP